MKKIVIFLTIFSYILCCQHLQAAAQDTFILQFKYACRENVDLDVCKANVFWNDQLVAKLKARDFNIQTLSVEIKARVGQNKLWFEGNQLSSSAFGLTIDDVSIVRVGTNQNIVINGGFQDPDVGDQWIFIESVSGWTGVNGFLEIGVGSLYNRAWNSQVLELNSDQSIKALQILQFDQNLQFIRPSNKFILSFKFACRNGINLSICKGSVLWNGYLLSQLKPDNFKIQTLSFEVVAKVGQNSLQFRGNQQGSQSFGLTIDDVSLVRVGTNHDIVVNGGFESPYVGKRWIFSNAIRGWTGANGPLQVGFGKLYNRQWNSQVLELNSDKGIRAVQVIRLDSNNQVISPEGRFELSFEYACRNSLKLGACQGNVFWNGDFITKLSPSNFNILTFTIQVDGEVGQNILQFEGIGVSDQEGLTIDNVRLIRFGTNEDIIVNGGFENPNVGHTFKFFNEIPGWVGINGLIQLGEGTLYNKLWKSQILELDSDKNTRVGQIINLDADFNVQTY